MDSYLDHLDTFKLKEYDCYMEESYDFKDDRPCYSSDEQSLLLRINGKWIIHPDLVEQL